MGVWAYGGAGVVVGGAHEQGDQGCVVVRVLERKISEARLCVERVCKLTLCMCVCHRRSGTLGTTLAFTFPASLLTLWGPNGMVLAAGASDTWAYHQARTPWSWTPGLASSPVAATACNPSNVVGYACMTSPSAALPQVVHWTVSKDNSSVDVLLQSPTTGGPVCAVCGLLTFLFSRESVFLRERERVCVCVCVRGCDCISVCPPSLSVLLSSAWSRTGWLAFGFSPGLTMIGASVVVANTTGVWTYKIVSKSIASAFTTTTSLNITNAALTRWAACVFFRCRPPSFGRAVCRLVVAMCVCLCVWFCA